MQLDLETDQQMLTKMLDSLRPKLLILDPLVRLHRLDENSASDISKLLGFLRGLKHVFSSMHSHLFGANKALARSLSRPYMSS